jgi:hypothetical protein
VGASSTGASVGAAGVGAHAAATSPTPVRAALRRNSRRLKPFLVSIIFLLVYNFEYAAMFCYCKTASNFLPGYEKATVFTYLHPSSLVLTAYFSDKVQRRHPP